MPTNDDRAQPLHNRFAHLFLRVHAGLGVLMTFVFAIAFGISDAPPEARLVVVCLVPFALGLAWITVLSCWTLHLTPSTVVAGRLWQRRTVPLDRLAGIDLPPHAWLGGWFWGERRLLVEGEPGIYFLCTREAEKRLLALTSD